MGDPGEAIVTRDEVVVVHLDDPAEAARALDLLDRAETELAADLVDETERARLEARAAARGDEGEGRWSALVARRDELMLGYAGLVAPAVPGSLATGDVVLPDAGSSARPVLAVLLAGLEAVGRRERAGRLQVWLRHVGAPELAVAEEAGFELERRLGVLGRDLGEPDVDASTTASDVTSGVTVRGHRPGDDDAGVVAVLAAAYADTPEAGWDLTELERRRELDWYRAEDLLVAEDADGWIAGVHWLKRRSPSTGEVYNLAVHPDAQGRGLGPVLLDAGLEHLRSVGCDEVLLWTDLANERAVALYTAEGFTTRWEDVALGRTLA